MTQHTAQIPNFLDVENVLSQGSTTYLIVGDMNARRNHVTGRYTRLHVIAINRLDGTIRCLGKGLDHNAVMDLTLRCIGVPDPTPAGG